MVNNIKEREVVVKGGFTVTDLNDSSGDSKMSTTAQPDLESYKVVARLGSITDGLAGSGAAAKCVPGRLSF